MSYIGNEPIVSATRTITEVTATAGQTVFTANGGYTVGYIDVFLNGAQLQTVDFTATNGTTITLTEAAQVGDVIRLVAWGTFLASNGVAKTGDTMTGDLSVERGSGLSAKVNVRGNGNTSSTDLMLMQGSDSVGYLYQKANAALVLGTNNTDRLVIDSSGRVTTPSQPFLFGRFGGATNNYQSLTVQSSRNASVATANGVTNSRFTAQIAGVYSLKLNNIFLSTTGRRDIKWYKNGTAFASSLSSDNGTGFAYRSISIDVYLNANDYVEIFSPAATVVYDGGGWDTEWTSFSITFLG